MKIPFAVLLLATSLSSAAMPAMQRSGPVSWMCAGVGSDERRALDELRPRVPLEILFVTAKRGAYVSDVELSVYRDGDREPLLRVTADGPECLLAAPPGAYRIDARYGGITRTARATIARAAGPPRKLAFAFPDEPWDGIRASPEEKAEAAKP
jgi:hypothetical protein